MNILIENFIQWLLQLDNIFIKTMKNLIYILIFIPSILFSQETKNMELVGVRNININSIENSQIIFDVDEGIILKILSYTHSQEPTSNISYVPWLKLNNEYDDSFFQIYCWD